MRIRHRPSLTGAEMTMGVFDSFDGTKGVPPVDFSDVSGGASSTTPSNSDTMYTVKSGDSLSKIAKAIYGDGTEWRRIFDANRDKINNPDLIHPGQELIIPGV